MLPQVGRTQFNIIASHIMRGKRNEIGSFRINIQLESTICKHFPIHAKKNSNENIELGFFFSHKRGRILHVISMVCYIVYTMLVRGYNK